MVRNIIENYVVTFSTFSEILFRVINDAIRAERADKIDIARAADAGHIRAQRLGYLHGKRADTSRCTINQDLLPLLNLSFVANSLQSRDAGYIDRSRLLKRQIGRFQRYCPRPTSSPVFGDSAASRHQHFVPWVLLRAALA